VQILFGERDFERHDESSGRILYLTVFNDKARVTSKSIGRAPERGD